VPKALECGANGTALASPTQGGQSARHSGESGVAVPRLRVGELCRRTYSSPKVIHKRRKDALLACSEPVVNNFGGLAKWVCKSFTIWLNRRVERAGSGRRIPHSNVMTVLWRFSLRDPASCRKGILRTFRLQVQKMQRRTSISASIRQGLRVQHHNHINPQLL